MARHPSTYEAVLTAADHYEPRFRTQMVTATLRLRKSVSLRELAAIITAKDSRRAVSYIKSLDTGTTLNMASDLVVAAFNHGGKIGATRVTKGRRG